MNKTILLYCFLIIINLTNELSNNSTDNYTNEIIYDYLVDLLKGMSKGNEGKCANAFIEKKASLIGEIVGLIEAALEADLSNALGHLYLISTLVEKECDITSIILLMIKLNDIKKDFIKVIGLRAMKNAKCLEDNMNNFLEIKPMNEKLQIIGKILSILLKINVDM